MAKKVGRPTKFKSEMIKRVIELGRDGASRHEIAYELDVCFNTLLNWEAEHPEFLQATTRARHLAQGWWEKQGRKGIWSRDFNATAYSLQVRNRFPDDWRDKQSHEVSGKDGGPIEVSTDDLRKRFAGRISGIASRVGANSGDPGANGNGASGS